MYGAFSPDNFELKEINNSNQFILSNHNSHTLHTFFKINELGEPFDQNYIYQPIGGSTSGAHQFYMRNDSTYELVGVHLTPGSYPAVVFISRYDSTLQNMIFTKFYEVRVSSPPGIVSFKTSDSSYAFGGGHSIAPGQYYPMLFKLDSALNVSWSQSYHDRVGYVQDMLQAADGGYFLLMHLKVEGMVLTKTDSIGNILWSKNFASPFRKAQRMLLNSDSTLTLLSYKNDHLLPNNYTGINPVLTKVDFSGNVLWSISYGDISNEFIFWAGNPILNIDAAGNNSSILCGSLLPQWHSYADMILMKLDSSGLPLWSRRYGNASFDELGSICHSTSDGGIIAGGFNNYQINNFPPIPNLATVTIIKTDSLGFSDGCLEYPLTISYQTDTPTVTNLTWSLYVDSLVTEIPSNMIDTSGTPTRNENMCAFVSLMELNSTDNSLILFPNPSDGTVHIKSESQMHFISVIDITGREVLFIPGLDVTEYEIKIPNASARIYFVRVGTQQGIVTLKCLVK